MLFPETTCKEIIPLVTNRHFHISEKLLDCEKLRLVDRHGNFIGGNCRKKSHLDYSSGSSK